MKYTEHAARRASQRGVPQVHIEMAYVFGRRRGPDYYLLTKKNANHWVSAIDKALKRIQQQKHLEAQ
jgi:hypothetical protein